MLAHQVTVVALFSPFPRDSRLQDDLKVARHATTCMAQANMEAGILEYLDEERVAVVSRFISGRSFGRVARHIFTRLSMGR
jgi:hypothetical protein